jgi:hypothetical protein
LGAIGDEFATTCSAEHFFTGDDDDCCLMCDGNADDTDDADGVDDGHAESTSIILELSACSSDVDEVGFAITVDDAVEFEVLMLMLMLMLSASRRLCDSARR